MTNKLDDDVGQCQETPPRVTGRSGPRAFCARGNNALWAKANGGVARAEILRHGAPVAHAHPDDVLAVFDHDAVWIDGNAILVHSSSMERRGVFRVSVPGEPDRVFAVPQSPADRLPAHDPRLDGDLSSVGIAEVLHDGLTAEACLARYELAQQDRAPLDLTTSQVAAARALWSARLRAGTEAK